MNFGEKKDEDKTNVEGRGSGVERGGVCYARGWMVGGIHRWPCRSFSLFPSRGLGRSRSHHSFPPFFYYILFIPTARPSYISLDQRQISLSLPLSRPLLVSLKGDEALLPDRIFRFDTSSLRVTYSRRRQHFWRRKLARKFLPSNIILENVFNFTSRTPRYNARYNDMSAAIYDA